MEVMLCMKKIRVTYAISYYNNRLGRCCHLTTATRIHFVRFQMHSKTNAHDWPKARPSLSSTLDRKKAL